MLFLFKKCCKNKETLLGTLILEDQKKYESHRCICRSRNKSVMALRMTLGSYSLGLTAAIALFVSFRTRFSVFSQDFREKIGFNSKNTLA